MTAIEALDIENRFYGVYEPVVAYLLNEKGVARDDVDQVRRAAARDLVFVEAHRLEDIVAAFQGPYFALFRAHLEVEEMQRFAVLVPFLDAETGALVVGPGEVRDDAQRARS